MNRIRSAAQVASVIDQAVAAFKETWLRAEGAVGNAMHGSQAPISPKPVVPIAPPVASSRTIGKGSRGDAVLELRIRLAGFGGLLPGDTFDDDTEDSVKQFEKDVMGRPETGIVDSAFAAALDKFAADWPVDVEGQLSCPCARNPKLKGCSGFGEGINKGGYSAKYAKSKDEAGHKYEYPGIHRSLLWAARALMFYATVDHKDEIRFLKFSSGYRCHHDNKKHNRSSTNHMGKAVDMQFSHGDGKKWFVADEAQTMKDSNAMRDVAMARMRAQTNWKDPDLFSLEPGGKAKKGSNEAHAPTWVHMDVRKWSAINREDSFFTKTSSGMEGTAFSRLLVQPGSFLQGNPR